MLGWRVVQIREQLVSWPFWGLSCNAFTSTFKCVGIQDSSHVLPSTEIFSDILVTWFGDKRSTSIPQRNGFPHMGNTGSIYKCMY